MTGNRLQVGSKVRVPTHVSDSMGVEIPAYSATIVEIVVDGKGTILRVRQRRMDHDRAVRPHMVRRIRYKAAAA